jgi:hypothetical protein
MNVTVIYGVDIFGDHTARPHRIIDTERRMFGTPSQAIKFAKECTELINADEIHQIMGAKTDNPPTDLQAEDLLLNKAEFIRFREVEF